MSKQKYTIPILSNMINIDIPGICNIKLENIENIYFSPENDEFKVLLKSGHEILFHEGEFILMQKT